MPITKQQIQELRAHPDSRQAKDLLDRLEAELQSDRLDQATGEQYKQWAVLLGLLALPQLPFVTIYSILQQHTGFALRQKDIDLENILTQVLTPYGGPGVDELKREIYQSLERDQEPLGSVQITMPDGTERPSTVGGWLAYHVIKVGRGRKPRVENLKYFAQDRNIAKLPENERMLLRRLLQLYNLLQPLPIDAARLDKLDERDIWWGVDVPGSLKGIVETAAGEFLPAAEASKQRQEEVARQRAKEAGGISSAEPQSTTDMRVAGSSQVIRLDVKRALEKYPETGAISLTTTPLTVAGQQLSGTLRSWLQDYALTVGMDYHTLQEREAYFFESSNAKTLSSTDKQKVRLVLQSFDEDLPLSFSRDFSSIVFDESGQRGLGSRTATGMGDIRNRLG